MHRADRRRLSVRLPCAAMGWLALTMVACSSLGTMRRTGPDFATAFPDPTVLVTCSDPTAMRAKLANVQLPATYEHHDRLIAILRSQPSISAAHLQLLVEAVHLPDCTIMSNVGGEVRCFSPRGESQFSRYADQLLIEGTQRLVCTDPAELGDLLGRTQGDSSLQALANRFVPALDDGSQHALQQLLRGLGGSPATVPFLTDYMLAQGRLDGSRTWAAMGMLTFDAERVALARAVAMRVRTIDAARLADAVRPMSFDAGRAEVVAALAGKARPVPAEIACGVIAAFSFDAGRQAACASLIDQGGARVDAAQLATISRMFSFDDGRLEAVRLFVPQVRGEISGADASALLDTFSFDSGRLGALRTLAPRLSHLPHSQQHQLLAAFSFSSNREAAATLLH